METSRDVYTPSRLNLEARTLLEGRFGLLWIEGELSNLARPSSGHIYFSLKDAGAQVRCAMFRGRNRLLDFRPADGQQVLIRARPSLYEGRGEFQLIVERMEQAGSGALQRAFEALKRRLDAEGLFAETLKRPLPAMPKRIGVITSPTGAALHDILHVLARRFPAIPVLVYPASVQGAQAPDELVAALGRAGRRGDCDVLIIARGGGSLEDLQAFNDERIARAIRACPVPVVSGVGHEIDFTICDFVADRRAPTPSAAAELVVPDAADWMRNLRGLLARSSAALGDRLERRGERVAWLAGRLRLQHPEVRLRQRAQRVDELEHRLHQAWARRGAVVRHRIELLVERLARRSPAQRLATLRAGSDALGRRLLLGIDRHLATHRQAVAATARALDVVSPLATLDRGYAIVSRVEDGRVLLRATDVAPGASVEARLAEGRLLCRVEQVIAPEQER